MGSYISPLFPKAALLSSTPGWLVTSSCWCSHSYVSWAFGVLSSWVLVVPSYSNSFLMDSLLQACPSPVTVPSFSQMEQYHVGICPNLLGCVCGPSHPPSFLRWSTRPRC